MDTVNMILVQKLLQSAQNDYPTYHFSSGIQAFRKFSEFWKFVSIHPNLK